MFSALPGPLLAGLVGQCRTLRLDVGQQVFTPMQKALACYIVLVGRVRIFKVSPKGDEQTLHVFGRGDSFGEAAMLMGFNFPAYAEATEPSAVLEVPRAALAKGIAGNAEFAMGMMAGLSAKLHEFAQLIEELSLKEVPARLAGVLVREAARHKSPTFRLRSSKRELAAQIGTVAETLSRALGKLKAMGLVQVAGSQVTVLDAEGLSELAQNG
jgi:CRP/FNR family transcriptional regulator